MRDKVQHVDRLAQTRLQNSGVTGPFTKFLSDVEEGSSTVLTRV